MSKWKCAFFAFAGLIGFCFSLAAQETPHAGLIQPRFFTLNQSAWVGLLDPRSGLSLTDVALNSPYETMPSLTFFDRGPFSLPGAFGWVAETPVNFLPAFIATEPLR